MLKPLPEVITKRTAGKHYVWDEDLRLARDVAARYVCMVYLDDAPYHVAKIKGDGVQLVLYPHQTSAGNHHMRVRDEGSRDAQKALEISDALNKSAGFNCTFSMKAWSHEKLVNRAKKQKTL
jgi:hypothetical protein